MCDKCDEIDASLLHIALDRKADAESDKYRGLVLRAATKIVQHRHRFNMLELSAAVPVSYKTVLMWVSGKPQGVNSFYSAIGRLSEFELMSESRRKC